MHLFRIEIFRYVVGGQSSLVSKYSDLLTTKGGRTVVNTTKLEEITRQLKMRGMRAQGQAQQAYASYARQRTVPQVKPLANGLRVVTGP
eukprot:COSAG02_NODE_38867_length_424_cov_0.523077_1_plen_88_part_10